jgi:hypothetical protein
MAPEGLEISTDRSRLDITELTARHRSAVGKDVPANPPPGGETP